MTQEHAFLFCDCPECYDRRVARLELIMPQPPMSEAVAKSQAALDVWEKWASEKDYVPPVLAVKTPVENVAAPVQRRQFEYHYAMLDAPHNIEQLNELGKAGWELCVQVGRDGGDWFYLFKREKV